MRQYRHRTIPADVSRDRQQAQDAKEDEAASLCRRIVGSEGGDVKTEREYEPDRRENAHEKVEMRRRLRNQMHACPRHVSAGGYQLVFGRTVSGVRPRLASALG